MPMETFWKNETYTLEMTRMLLRLKDDHNILNDFTQSESCPIP